MDALTLARWQFGITTVYHFFFVPLTLGLVWVVAGLADRLVRRPATRSGSASRSSGASSSSSTSRWASSPASCRSSSSG